MSQPLFQTSRYAVHAMSLPDKPDDLDRRIAQLLKQAQADKADDPPAEPLDEATLRRVMNGLRARGAFDTPAAARTPPARAGLRALAGWLRPGAAQSPARGAAAAAGAGRTAALIAPRWLLPAAFVTALLLALAWTGRGSSPSPAEPVNAKGGSSAKSGQTAPVVVYSEHPTADASRLGEQMAQLGIAATMTRVARGMTVEAQVPPTLQLRATEVLQAEGLALPPDGRLAVQFMQLE